MKSVYWRPQKVSPTTTLWIGITAVLMLIGVESAQRIASFSRLAFGSVQATQRHAQQLQANQLAEQCRHSIRDLRKANGLPINHIFDPTNSGLLGSAMTSITSKPANLEAKQLSLHPQLPAACVQILLDAGVQQGDVVAVGWTGSFPAMNVALAAAMETLDLRPIIISSVTASQYGANETELTWLDMERTLRDQSLIQFSSHWATVGGPADCGKGMCDTALIAVADAMHRNQVNPLKTRGLGHSIRSRMRCLKRQSSERPIAAYINVGGGVASCGGKECVFDAGLYAGKPLESPPCVMQQFCDLGTPVIHLARPRSLLPQFGLSRDSEDWTAASAVGIVSQVAPSRILALLAILMISGILSAFVLHDLGYQLVQDTKRMLGWSVSFRIVGQEEGPQLMA